MFPDGSGVSFDVPLSYLSILVGHLGLWIELVVLGNVITLLYVLVQLFRLLIYQFFIVFVVIVLWIFI